MIAHELVGNVDPIQYTIRLLVPEGSLLLDRPELAAYLDGFDGDGLTWRWRAADPRVDELQATIARIVNDAMGSGEPTDATWERVFEACGRPSLVGVGVGSGRGSVGSGRVGSGRVGSVGSGSGSEHRPRRPSGRAGRAGRAMLTGRVGRGGSDRGSASPGSVRAEPTESQFGSLRNG